MTNNLIDLSKQFAVDVINFCDMLRGRKKASVILSQLIRSGTSIGANIHEASYASSRSDFVNKLQIALKECNETSYWLDVFHDALVITDVEYLPMFNQCSKIRKLLVTSVNTAKGNGTNKEV